MGDCCPLLTAGTLQPRSASAREHSPLPPPAAAARASSAARTIPQPGQALSPPDSGRFSWAHPSAVALGGVAGRAAP